MVCSHCNTLQDPDARFCEECGAALSRPRRNRSAYGYALLLLAVIILACAAGYYKYFLPRGVVAVVNGEEITRADLEQAVSRISGSGGTADANARYQALNALIEERAMLQEARRAGTDVSRGELSAAIEAFRLRSGLDAEQFNRQAESQYGSRKKFEDAFRNGLIINKFVYTHVVPQHADVQIARQAVEQWEQKTIDSAAIRVTLAEQWSGAGCECCSSGADPRAGSGQSGCLMAANGTIARNKAGAAAEAALNSDKAAEAGLAYWRKKHGNDAVTAKVMDFGCHMQVDILEGNKTIGSLRYQGGRIFE